MIKRLLLLFFIINILISCSQEPKTLFKLLLPEQTGIGFQNDIMEDEYLNILSNEYIYNGAGVGIGDFNNDDLQDIFFSGSQVTNRLYMNKGDLTFNDITLESHIADRGRWSAGVAVVDINNDGWQDIYVCASNHLDPDMRRNRLFIHEGLNEDGNPVFSEQAKEFGIDDEGYSTHAAFFDYDNDGDLDLYVLTNFLDTPTPNKYREKKLNGSAESNDRLYRNNGNNTFTNVTLNAGIVYEGYGLGISIVDFNNDGWRDIYITNDYLTNDLMYINNRDGTFSNQIEKYIKHQTHSAMGHDIADINNDGLVDIFTLDMLPEDNQGIKKMHGVTRFENEQLNEELGYQSQYKRNMLQINNGPDAYGNHNFSEIGLMAGIYATEWCWSALLADYDNDGYRDLFVSNGYPRDVTDLDYAVSGMSRGRGLSNEEVMMIIPVRRMSNYIFKNNGDLSFTNKTVDWGMEKESFANGAAYVDLDNDGDLDLVTSNYNEPAMIYENRLYNGKGEKENHYLRIKLKGKSAKLLGAKIYVFSSEGDIKFADHSNFGGYRSTVDPVIHFGLGKTQLIDSLIVIWPDGMKQKITEVSADQILAIEYKSDKFMSAHRRGRENGSILSLPDSSQYLFKETSQKYGLKYKHDEKVFNDYQLQNTLPHQFSRSGPSLAVGDVDGNGLMDLFIGGSSGNPGLIFYQEQTGFVPKSLEHKEGKPEDYGALIFDADGDGDLDLYVVSGGVEQGLNPANYQDRLFVNDGKGNFKIAVDALPAMPVSGSCVKGADFDLDGDLDLFIGGRLLPGNYPQKVNSFILRNDSEESKPKFTNVSDEVCPDLNELGLVADALWTDFNNDQMIDLVIVGEWMPVTFFQNEGGKFKNVTGATGIDSKLGWWNSLTGGDFDNDGDIDYIAGNEGLNSFFKASKDEPITAYSSDFDNNGRYDVVLTSYTLSKDGSRKAFPVHFRSDFGKQLELMKKRFTTYEAYSEATIEDLFVPEELENAQKSIATWMASSYIENLGHGKFAISALPNPAQIAPIFGMQTGDFNEDDFLDLLVVGNFYGNSIFWGRMDALNGLLMLGDGKGGFECMDYTKTGFLVPGDAKALVTLPMANGKQLYISSQNRDSLKVFEIDKEIETILLDKEDTWAEIEFSNGTKRKQEFYWGNGYLSQSSRIFEVPKASKAHEIFTTNGETK